MNNAEFFGYKPTQLARIGDFSLYEHPTACDNAPIFLYNVLTRHLVNTYFYDLGEFDLALCMEIESGAFQC